MLDQVVRFADEVPSDQVTITVDKTVGFVSVAARGIGVSVAFPIDKLKASNGGILNDQTVLKKLRGA